MGLVVVATLGTWLAGGLDRVVPIEALIGARTRLIAHWRWAFAVGGLAAGLLIGMTLSGDGDGTTTVNAGSTPQTTTSTPTTTAPSSTTTEQRDLQPDPTVQAEEAAPQSTAPDIETTTTSRPPDTTTSTTSVPTSTTAPPTTQADLPSVPITSRQFDSGLVDVDANARIVNEEFEFEDAFVLGGSYHWIETATFNLGGSFQSLSLVLGIKSDTFAPENMMVRIIGLDGEGAETVLFRESLPHPAHRLVNADVGSFLQIRFEIEPDEGGSSRTEVVFGDAQLTPKA